MNDNSFRSPQHFFFLLLMKMIDSYDSFCATNDRGDNEFTSGRVFWDVQIVKTNQGKINVGVCTLDANFSSYLGGDEYGWSYYGHNGE